MLEQTKVTFEIQFMLHSQQLEISVLKVISQCCSVVGLTQCKIQYDFMRRTNKDFCEVTAERESHMCLQLRLVVLY